MTISHRLAEVLLKLVAPASSHQNMPSQPSAKRVAKARAGVIGSSSRFERLLRESGAFDSLTPQEVVQLQHTIEQYAVAIAANNGIRVRGSIEVRAAAQAREDARGGAPDA